MTKLPPPPFPESSDEQPDDPSRRRLLGGLALGGAALAIGGTETLAAGAKPAASSMAPAAIDEALRKDIQQVVVIYLENRSFNNLFANFPGVEQPLGALKPDAYLQRDRDGSVLKELPPIWHGLAPHKQTVNHRDYQVTQDHLTGLPNAPWALRTGDGEPLPHGVVTRDLIHAFYENQRQINGGKNDGFVAWGDTGAMVMGHYDDSASNLRLWQLARQYTLCDNWFMGAFGGSFLNHQYLVAAQPPFYPNADHSPAQFNIAVTESGKADDPRLKLAEDSPHSAMDGKAKPISRSQLTPDFWAVNTMMPPYQPTSTQSGTNPLLASEDSPNTLPPQLHKTIGDVLSAKGVDWAWYAGAWQLALDGKGDGDEHQFPQRPNFQIHHQPLNYFKSFAPGTDARAKHLRDAGVGETSKTNRFLADIEANRLPTVSFYKPQGDLNMHAGYSDVDTGDRHVMAIVDALQKSPSWKHTMVIITVDENGGWWDHVAPPKGDRWGPGSRIPALVVSPFAKKGHVDHTIYDTGSIARFLTRRFGLEKLPGLSMREQAMIAAGGPPPGDLTNTLELSA